MAEWSNVAPLEKIKSLVEFLKLGLNDLQSLFKFVAIDTLYPLSAFAVLLNVVRLDGTLAIPAWYGIRQEQVEALPERSVRLDTPLNRSLRTATVVSCGSFDEYLFSGPFYAESLFPRGFASSIAWPIPGVGSAMTFCEEKIELTLEMELFLLTVGGVLSLQFAHTNLGGLIHREEHPRESIAPVALTFRQWSIAEAIRRGMTNPAIAKDLGFSESLVRQETMQIYRKLAVTGRKELIEKPVFEPFPVDI